MEHSGSSFLHGYYVRSSWELSSWSGRVWSVVSSIILPHRPPVECSWTCFVLFSTRVWPLCFVIQLVLRRKNIQSLVSYTETRSLSFIVWSPVRNLAMVIFGAWCPGAYWASGTIRAFTAEGKTKTLPATVSLIPQTRFSSLSEQLFPLLCWWSIVWEPCFPVSSDWIQLWGIRDPNMQVLDYVLHVPAWKTRILQKYLCLWRQVFPPIIHINRLNTLKVVQQLFFRGLLTVSS